MYVVMLCGGITMKDIIIAIISSGLFSGAVAAFISLISTKESAKKIRKESVEKIEEGLRLLLLSSLRRDGRDAIQKGDISKEDYEAFKASYDAYKALGGDGWADKVKDQVDRLPVNIDD